MGGGRECGHLWALIWLGGYGVIRFAFLPLPHWECVVVEAPPVEGWEPWFFFAGGWCGFGTFLALFIWDYLWHDDPEEGCAALLPAVHHLVYGTAEGVCMGILKMPFEEFVPIGNLCAEAGWVIGALLATWLLVKSWARQGLV